MIFPDPFKACRLALMVSALMMHISCGANAPERTGAAGRVPPPSRWKEVGLPAVAHDTAAVNALTFLTPERGWLLRNRSRGSHHSRDGTPGGVSRRPQSHSS